MWKWNEVVVGSIGGHGVVRWVICGQILTKEFLYTWNKMCSEDCYVIVSLIDWWHEGKKRWWNMKIVNSASKWFCEKREKTLIPKNINFSNFKWTSLCLWVILYISVQFLQKIWWVSDSHFYRCDFLHSENFIGWSDVFQDFDTSNSNKTLLVFHS